MSSPDASGQSPAIAPPANTAPSPPNTGAAVTGGESVASSPPPSKVIVAWLAVFLVNIIIVAFLLPEWIYDSKQVTTLTKVLPALLAVLFTAGLLWLRGIAGTLPKQRWFQLVNGVAFVLLLPVMVSQQNVVPVYPDVNAEGTKIKLLVDDKERAYDPGGRVWLSFGAHTIKIVPDTEKAVAKEGEATEPEVEEGQFKVTLGHVVYRLFGYYWPKWGPLYRVGVITPEANVDVAVQMTKGQFDSFYLAHPPLTKLNVSHSTTFKIKPGSVNEFLYHGANGEYGCIDRLYLPSGHYSFTASREGCENKPKQELKIGIDPGPYTVSFDPLCSAAP